MAMSLLALMGAGAAQASPLPISPALTRQRALSAAIGQSASGTTFEPACAARAGHGQAHCLADVLVQRSTRSPVHPDLSRPGALDHPGLVATTTEGGPPRASALPLPGTPAYLQEAYDLTALSQSAGAGDTVAVVDAYDDPTAERDLAAYRTSYGLPACTKADGCFHKVNEGGSASPLPEANGEWGVEESLDLDAVSALCSNCHILLVEAREASMEDLGRADDEAYALGAAQVSNSWGADEEGSPEAEGLSDSSFSFPHASSLYASGDEGYSGERVNQYPASLPDVSSIGGTTLLEPAAAGEASPRGATETTWGNGAEGTASGCNENVPQPAWQTGLACAGRAYDDISADADPYTGLDVYDSALEGWALVGGTSEATPLTAAYYALVGGVADGDPEWDYTSAPSLYDITSGSDSILGGRSCSTFICDAGLGYDGPTGNGSISGSVVEGPPGVAGPSQTDGGYVTSEASTSATLSGGVYPNQRATECYWQWGTSTSYGHSTQAALAGDGSGAQAGAGGLVPVSGQMEGLEAGVTYHYRLVARSEHDGQATTAYGYDRSLDFTGHGASGQAPGVGDVHAGATGTGTALLSGVVSPNGSATQYYFAYGTSSSYGSTTTVEEAGSGTGSVDVSANIGKLSPDTTYHYALVAVNASGGRTQSSDESFTSETGPEGAGTPEVTNLTASGVEDDMATVSATIGPHTGSLLYAVSYGKTRASEGGGSSYLLAPSATPTPIGYVITGLSPATTYHYALVLIGEAGEVATPEATFTTLAEGVSPTGTTPALASVTVSAVGTTSATLEGSVSSDGAPTSYHFAYGPTGAYGQSTGTVQASPSDTVAAAQDITGLEPGTTYHYTLVATNAFGQTAYADQTFQTASLPVSQVEAPTQQEGPRVSPIGQVEARRLTLVQQDKAVRSRHRLDVALTVSDPSHAKASDVVICEALPRGTTVATASRHFKLHGGTICFSAATLDPRGREVVSLSLSYGSAHGTLTLAASASAHGFTTEHSRLRATL